jgi:hypothetical protein
MTNKKDKIDAVKYAKLKAEAQAIIGALSIERLGELLNKDSIKNDRKK